MLTTKLKVQDKTIRVVNKEDVKAVGDFIEVTNNTILAAKCIQCNKIHPTNDETRLNFLTIIGNVHRNMNAGLIGNGDWDEHSVPVTHICPDCLIDKIKEWKEHSNTLIVEEDFMK